MRKVLKYGTGHLIPKDAVYLSTEVEKAEEYEYRKDGKVDRITTTNLLVWHYFLVELP